MIDYYFCGDVLLFVDGWFLIGDVVMIDFDGFL